MRVLALRKGGGFDRHRHWREVLAYAQPYTTGGRLFIPPPTEPATSSSVLMSLLQSIEGPWCRRLMLLVVS